jgi:hypothetical protein
MCKTNCKLCKNLIISDSVTIVDGTLVIDIPSTTFRDCERLCLIIAQTIPAATTIATPVAISIGGDTTTTYPVVGCDCAQITACALRTRTKYPLKVNTTATSAVFKVLSGLSCSPNNTLASIPAPVVAP